MTVDETEQDRKRDSGRLAPIMLLALLRTVCATSLLLWFAGTSNSAFIRAASQTNAKSGNGTSAVGDNQNQCRDCHAVEVDGFARSKMSRSMRLGAQEPTGIVQVPDTTIRIYSDKDGSWQTLESHGGTDTYHVDYVIGSGTHASGYIIGLADHLFQSPVAYYPRRAAYALAPGYEGTPDPDFTRPVAVGCVFCHAGSFDVISGTENEYEKTPFPHLSIGCDRCHGPTAAHLKSPSSANIVNPARLEVAARDGICEQCHLKGAARVLNPGKQFSDFIPGQRLEDTFTIYHDKPPDGTEPAFKVISHSEQLALSKCKRSSGQRMWCGTCHNPHDEPTNIVSYYRSRCLTCHAKTSFASNHPSKSSNCIGCHMPKKEATDGGHTVFTDHRIQARPEYVSTVAATIIAPWRQPPDDLATRNLGIASIQVGMEQRSGSQILNGYRMLTEIQEKFSQDSEIYTWMGSALFVGRQYGEAVKAFDLAVRLDPKSSPKEASLGQAYAVLGQVQLAEQHFERAMKLDPLNLAAAAILINIYDKNGQTVEAEALSQRIASLVHAKGGR